MSSQSKSGEGSLLHHLNVNLRHVHLLTELWRELCLPQQLCVHGGSHCDLDGSFDEANEKVEEQVHRVFPRAVKAGFSALDIRRLIGLCFLIDKPSTLA